MNPHAPSLEDALEEFLHQRRGGSQLDARTFAARYPELGEDLVRALESAELLECAFGAAAHAHAPPDPQLPERFGDFRVLERLGGGGMGVVYRARQESLGRDVALKLIRPEHLYFPNARERFRREAEAAARLQHPGLVPIHTVGEADGVPYLAMELVSGATLAQALRELRSRSPESLTGADLATALKRSTSTGSSWDEARARAAFAGGYVENVVRLAIQVAEALEHAHSREVLHRDVKPSNIAVTDGARALLFDFGLAILGAGDERLTASRAELGSLAYMSPEQLRGERDAVDRRMDVYALGVSLYELLTLRLPFEGSDTLETRRQVLEGAASGARTFNRSVSRDLDTVCAKAMERDAQRRYPDAAALARDLRNVLEKRPIEARPAGVALQVRRWMQRHPVAAIALAALVATPTLLLWRESAHAQVLAAALGDAERERETARIEARDASELNEFLTGLFQAADPAEARGRDVTARELLDVAARRLDEGHLNDQPIVRARLMTSIGESYASLGVWDDAERLLNEAVALSESVDGGVGLSTAHSLDALASLEYQLGRPTGLEHAERACALHRKLAPEPTFEFSETLMTYGLALSRAGDHERAEAIFREALAVVEGLPGPWLSARAGVLTNIAHTLMLRGDPRAAIETARQSIALQREFDAAPHPAISTALNTIALSLRSLERYDEALEVYDELLAEEARLTGEDSARFASFLASKSNIAFDTGEFDEAIALRERAVGLLARAAPPTFGAALRSREMLADAYERAGRWKDSLAVLRARQPAVEEAYGVGSAQAASGRVRIALACESLAAPDEARAELRAVLERAREVRSADGDAVECIAAALLARWKAAEGDLEGARELVTRAQELRGERDVTTAAGAWTQLAAGLLAQCDGEADFARAQLEPVAEYERGAPPADAAPALARARLALSIASSDPARAFQRVSASRKELQVVVGADHPQTRELQAWLEMRAAAGAAPRDR
jgi:serine/threonine protein kinase